MYCNIDFIDEASFIGHLDLSSKCKIQEETHDLNRKESNTNDVYFAGIIQHNSEIILVDNDSSQEVLVIEEPIVYV